jgi:hypothetical protein
LYGEFERVYFEITNEKLNIYGLDSTLITYCTFREPYINRIELHREEPVGVVVDVESWRDVASRLSNSRNKPKTVRDHKPYYSKNMAPDSHEVELFKNQYKDNASQCIIEFDCKQDSKVACRRRITASEIYEEPLPTPRLTLIYWEKLYQIMSAYGIDSININGKEIKNKFTQFDSDHQRMCTDIYPTPSNEREYGNRNLFYSDKVSTKQITEVLYDEIKHRLRRKSPIWLNNVLSVPDSKITFETSRLRRIDASFDNNNHLRNTSNYSLVRSRILTNRKSIKRIVDIYDKYISPPYPIELEDSVFKLNPRKYESWSEDLTSFETEGPSFRKSFLNLDSIVEAIPKKGIDEVSIESDPDIDQLAVTYNSVDMTLRFILHDVS